MKKLIFLVLAALLLSGCANTQSTQNPIFPIPESIPTEQSTLTTAPDLPTETTAPIVDETDLLRLAKAPAFIIKTTNSQTIYANIWGEILDEPILDYGSNNLAAAKSNNKLYGYVDLDGVFVIAPQYVYAGKFASNGLAPVAIKNDKDELKYGYINAEGTLAIPCEFDYAATFHDNGYAVVGVEKEITDEYGSSKETLYGVIDKNGNYYIDATYESVKILDKYILTEDYQAFSSWGYTFDHLFIIKDGEEPLRYNKTFYLYRDSVYCSGISSNKNEDILLRFNGTNFVDSLKIIENENDCDYLEFIEHDFVAEAALVATTETGVGFKLTYKGQDITGYQYDMIDYLDNFLLAFTYDTSTKTIYTDVYDIQTGRKTAEHIPGRLVGSAIMSDYYVNTPDGLFLVISTSKTYGIVDCNGNFILEPIYKDIDFYKTT